MNGTTACWHTQRLKKNRKNKTFQNIRKRENIYAKRPMCLLCFLMVLSLGALELMGIPLIRGNPLPLNVQEQIEAHLVP